MTIQEELDSMINALEGESSNELQGTTTVPSTDAPEIDSPNTDAPSTTSPATTAPASVAPATDAPDSKDDLARYIEENSQLKARIEALEKGEVKPTSPTTETPTEPLNFISESDLEDALNDPNKLNDILGKVYTRAVNDTKKLFEPKLSDLPGIVSEQVNLLENMKKVYNDFYDTNPDLKPFQKVVKVVFEELSAENPDKIYVDVVKDVAPEVRRRLGLKEGKKADAVKPDGKGVPPLPGKKGRTGTPSTNEPSNNLVSEIDEMNKALER